SLFVSHGAPTLILEDVPARDFLRGLGGDFARPQAVVAVSAHWETARPTIGTSPRPQTIHDFHGFPVQLYQLTYPALGAPDLAVRIIGMLQEAGLAAGADPVRGLDHGAWVPLRLMYPEADIPVLQLSVQPERGPSHHLAVGRALAPLRDENVLVLASGGAVHNLRELNWHHHAAPPAWAREFDDWLASSVQEGAVDDLVAYRERAPHAVRAHPRDEHFLPLFV